MDLAEVVGYVALQLALTDLGVLLGAIFSDSFFGPSFAKD